MNRLILLLLLLVPGVAQAQVNLVRNGGFEQYDFCPTDYDQIKKAVYWNTIDTLSMDAGCAPEYCNACADSVTTPLNVPAGGSYHHSARSGVGMVESNMYFNNSYSGEMAQRNYTQGRLFNHLAAGTNYCVTFYVTLAQRSGYASNMIGAYLDNGSIDSGQDSSHCGLPKTAFTPQIVDTTIIKDTLHWVKIQGSFVANGSEQFITIGNFFDINHTDSVKLNYPQSYGPVSVYLIDDVSVIESNAVANAGSDMASAVGDTVLIGTHEEGMPCTWYALGDTTPLGYGGGIKVHPLATGTYHYVVMLDLCAHVTYDTMTLFVWPAGVNNGSMVQLLNGSFILIRHQLR